MTDEAQNITGSSNECDQDLSVEDISPENQIHDLMQRLDELKQSNDNNVDATQRAQAELANYRKRADEENN
jgi:molecular chaperone GrpE (heat shock protein)